MSESAILWSSFSLFVIGMLALDLGVFHRKSHTVSVKEALTWTIVWITLAMLFNLFVYYYFGKEKAIEFFTAYLVEKSLSIDNIFVIIMIEHALENAVGVAHYLFFLLVFLSHLNTRGGRIACQPTKPTA